MSKPYFKHIILADDDVDDIESFEAAITECSLNILVTPAKNGRVLLEMLEKNDVPDLILLDLNMPIMNGYECLRKIRKDEKYNSIPIMIFSTSASTDDIDFCFINGANFYVVKPPTFDALTKVVNDIAKGVILNQTIKWAL